MSENKLRHCVVADDVRPYRELLRTWFSEWGFRCTATSRAKEAWETIEKRGADLVVTDIDMPEISGLQLIHAIRASDCMKRRAIPVIAISSLNDTEIGLITQQVGAIRFVPKPLDKSSMHAAVMSVLGIPDQTPRERSESESMVIDKRVECRVSPRLRRLFDQLKEFSAVDLGNRSDER